MIKTRIIVLIGFILHCFELIVYSVKAFYILPSTYEELEIKTDVFFQFLVLVVLAAFAAGYLIFYLYLEKKNQEGKPIKYTLSHIVILILITMGLSAGLIGIAIVSPLYKSIGNL